MHSRSFRASASRDLNSNWQLSEIIRPSHSTRRLTFPGLCAINGFNRCIALSSTHRKTLFSNSKSLEQTGCSDSSSNCLYSGNADSLKRPGNKEMCRLIRQTNVLRFADSSVINDKKHKQTEDAILHLLIGRYIFYCWTSFADTSRNSINGA